MVDVGSHWDRGMGYDVNDVCRTLKDPTLKFEDETFDFVVNAVSWRCDRRLTYDVTCLLASDEYDFLPKFHIKPS
jgi:hypothetical protein